MNKYYLAYEERYKRVHSEGLSWFKDQPTPELLEWVECNNIDVNDEICDVGCGEGRDALHLAQKGYKITALDVSQTAIKKCTQLASQRGIDANFVLADILSADKTFGRKFNWIYSIATLHLLVEDEDRKQFLDAVYNMLRPEGKLLLINKGDGQLERESNPSTAFHLQERTVGETGRKIMVASTSYRAVNWVKHKQEIERAGFIIKKALDTENDEYDQCMTVYLKRE
ncbi:class I SAM-dependent methyltransferase [Paenibacillus marinisediminis]